MSAAVDAVPAAAPFVVRLYAPIPPLPEEDARGVWHGGFKVDARSEVGRTGALLDWQVPVRSVDAGMPADVARALADALCAVAAVTGCTLALPADVGPEWTPVPGGHARRLGGPWWRRGDRVGLLASRAPAVVAGLFADESFPWWNESQLLLLTPPGVLPALDRAAVDACFALPMRVSRAQLAAAGVVGLVRAGVDGDVAGLYFPAPEWRSPLVGALAAAVTAAGGRWEKHDGAEHAAVAGARP
jgi:hypothetical protein